MKIIRISNLHSNRIFKFAINQVKITIGRSKNCDISIDSLSLSKRHCTFTFESDLWLLRDGMDDNPSTNGTWLINDDKIELSDLSIFKIENSIFKIEGLI